MDNTSTATHTTPVTAAAADYPYSDATRVADLVTMATMLLLGVVGNLLLGVTAARLGRQRTPTDVLVINMVLADLLVTASMAPILGNIVAKRNVLLADGGPDACRLMGFLVVLGCVASVYSLGAIAAARMCLVCYHARLATYFSTRFCVGYAALVWVLAVVLSLPPYLGWGRLSYSNKFLQCSSDYTASLSFTLYLNILAEGGILTITFCCYGKIYRTVRATSSKMAAHTASSSPPASSAKDDSNQAKRLRQRQKQAFCSFVISALFVLMWSPFCVLTVVDVFYDVSPHVIKIATWLGLLNSCVNGFVYIAINRNYRNAFIRLWPCFGRDITPG